MSERPWPRRPPEHTGGPWPMTADGPLAWPVVGGPEAEAPAVKPVLPAPVAWPSGPSPWEKAAVPVWPTTDSRGPAAWTPTAGGSEVAGAAGPVTAPWAAPEWPHGPAAWGTSGLAELIGLLGDHEGRQPGPSQYDSHDSVRPLATYDPFNEG